uniref:uncharacterized protein LOC109953845 isoform X5 n=1 Tax=Monopterus albus TaxID=43700 RepID=UPI0009B42311|nr:uncharacterized protein LOC109953845 isoform X5 [Monopterus albus]
MTGPKRTWQQVKIKYKNILQNAVKKNTHKQGTGGGSPKADLTPAEDMALELNKGRPVLEGIPGGKETSIGPSQDATRFIQVSGSTVFLLEPPAQAPDNADPGEGPSAAATEHDGDDDGEETISLDSRRHEVSCQACDSTTQSTMVRSHYLEPSQNLISVTGPRCCTVGKPAWQHTPRR